MQAKNEFDTANSRTNELISSIIEKSDQILVNLTIKFTKEIQLKWYEEMQRVFNATESLEQQMSDIAFRESQHYTKYSQPSKTSFASSKLDDPF
jgi:hypothetical protein